MSKKFNYTFDAWNKGECGEVTHVTLDPDSNYQSEYVYVFNYLRDRDWKKVAGRWVNPRPPHQTYGTMQLAYGAQKYYETVHNEEM